MTMYYAFNTQ